MRFYKPGDTWRKFFFTERAETRVPTDADTTPTVAVWRNGTVDGAVSVTVTNKATGHYEATCTIPGGYAAGDELEFVVSATVNDIPGVRTIDAPVLASVTRGTAGTALPDAAATSAGGLFTLGSGPGQVEQNENGVLNAYMTSYDGQLDLATGEALQDIDERTVAIVEDTMLILSVLAGFNDVSAAEVANAILEVPVNKIETDSEGRVRTSNPGGGSSGPTAAEIWNYAQRTLTEGVAVAYPAQQVGNRRAVSGDDYGPTARRFLITKQDGADWPDDLSLYSWTFKCNKATGNANAAASSSVTCTAAVATATGDGRSFDISITAADSASAEGQYRYTLRGTRTSDSKKYSAEIGILTFVKDEN